jgi:hypothetical protein
MRMSAARPLAAVSIRTAAAELVAHAEGSGSILVNGQGHRLCNELDANQKRTAALVKACGLHKAPLSYGREQLAAHLVINMTVLSRPALWQHSVVRRGLLDSAGLGGFRNQTQDAGLPIRYVWERHRRSVESLLNCPSSICATGHICKWSSSL